MKKHLFHILPNSPWPILSAFSVFFLVSGLAFYMHKVNFSGYFLIFGFMCLLYCIFYWFCDIINEATLSGYHTKAVRLGLRLGFFLFIISEIVLFSGFFWAFFHASLCPSIEIGSIFPPIGIKDIPIWGFPFFNTLLLIFSGFSITWTHRAMSIGSFKDAIDSLVYTLVFGFSFLSLQLFEYYEAPFDFTDSVYACSFYMLTGLHGCHVFVGAMFILVCFIRLLKRHYLTTHYLGLVFAIWYWHFVDGVWILLFLSVYCWGSW